MDFGQDEWAPPTGPLDGIERRRDQRILIGAVDCRVRAARPRLLRPPEMVVAPVRAVNVSPTGVGFTTDPRDYLQVGTEVTFVVDHAESRAVIRRVTPTCEQIHSYGAEFTDAEPAVVEEIFRLTGHRTHPPVAAG